MYIHPYQILTLHCHRNKVFLLLLRPNLKPDEIKKTIIICALVTILILGGVISAVSLLFNHPLRIENLPYLYRP